MAQLIGKYAANKVLKKHVKSYEHKKVEGGDDPYFAYIEDPKRPGKYKKVKKQIPSWVSEHDTEVLGKVRRRSYRMDMSLFNLFGIRFGWEAIIGLIPGFGDAIGVLIALSIFKTCCQVEGGLPTGVKVQMMLNIMIDFAVGLVPFLGDLADAAFKANTKNCRLLEKHIESKRARSDENVLKEDARAYGGDSERRRKNRASGIYNRHDPPPATAFDFSDEEDERRQYSHQHNVEHAPVQPPQPTREAEDRRGGWFSGGRRESRRERQPPVREISQRQQQTGRVHR